jgi:hypothetical protein
MIKSRSKRTRCAHDARVLVAYFATGARAHASSSWCPDCGALGHVTYAGDCEERWQLPAQGPR